MKLKFRIVALISEIFFCVIVGVWVFCLNLEALILDGTGLRQDCIR